MSIAYKTIAKVNPRDLSAKKKYYASLVKRDGIDLKQMSIQIAERSTVNREDVYAVILGMTEIMASEFEKGNTVYLGEFGAFQMGIKAEGMDAPDGVRRSSIKRIFVKYRTGSRFKRMIKGLRFKKEDSKL